MSPGSSSSAFVWGRGNRKRNPLLLIGLLSDGSQSATISMVSEDVSAGQTPCGFTPFVHSPCFQENGPGRAIPGVVATSRFLGTGYQLFSQVRAFTPHTQGIYSPQLATTLVAAFWLPTGYHPKTRKRGISPDVAARADTRWTREHRSEKRELLSGNSVRRTKDLISRSDAPPHGRYSVLVCAVHTHAHPCKSL